VDHPFHELHGPEAHEFGVSDAGEGALSTDGASWTPVAMNVGSASLNAVAWLDGVYVVAGRSGLIMSSR